MKIIIAILFTFVATSNLCLSEEYLDEIHMKDSTVIRGTITILVPEKHIIITNSEGKSVFIPMDKISRISKIDKLSISLLDTSYLEMGISCGTPSIINLEVGYWLSHWGLSISGNGLPTLLGIQANFRYKIHDNYKSCSNINLIVGKKASEISNGNNNFHYLGMAFGINWNGLTMELGLAREINKNSYLMILQIGYTYRFI